MESKRVQGILDDETLARFRRQAKKQHRTESALVRRYVKEGILRDEKEQNKTENN